MQPTLEGYALALLGGLDAGALATTAGELASFDRAILSQPELRAVLTDTALNPAVRSRVLTALVEGKVAPATLHLLAYAALHAHAQDLPHAVSELAVNALVQVERGSMDIALLGLLAARRRTEGCVDALLQSVDTADFARIESELFSWARAIEDNADLRRILVDRDAAVASRLGVVHALLEGKVSASTLQIARYAVLAGRARDIVGTIDHCVDYVARARDWRVARVHAARMLDDADEAALATALTALTGRNVELQVVTDAALLGGVVVEVGDLRLDASTKGRLGALHDAVLSGRVLQTVVND